jgi:hypothetical protein
VPKPQTSPRSKRVWKRLIEWYGTRIIEQYGEAPPDDWREIIDDIDNTQVKRGLSIIRSRFIQHPPTLPQFDQAMRPSGTEQKTGPNPAERLCAHVMRNYGRRMSAKQIRGPWTYVGRPDGEITGVVIDADGDHAGYRVMLEDLDAPDFKPQPPALALV